ncbi:hypothetical protein BaRGS_00013417 [Batillaria attramentaria]|uniref:3'-5' exonuclease domain-containing protein n=1 Tax=Batillaria attramentaria TaxID=370345 RepID=A0ABD0L7U8_9CAEN
MRRAHSALPGPTTPLVFEHEADGKMDAQYVGHRVLLETTNNQRVSGFIQSVNLRNKKITLQGVEIQPERKESLLQLKEEKPAARKPGPSIQHHKETPRHLHKLRDLNHNNLLLSKTVSPAGEKSDDQSGSGDSEEADTGNASLPKNCTLIDDCKTDLFKEAVAYLLQQSVLAVSFEGVRLGRSGKLCWILMASREHTMFFDVLTMGKDCMEAGLKQILESPAILKVTHDCRLASDIMHHQYGVKLMNIFDTQVADVMVYRLEHGSNCLPRYVSGLGECLQKYLSLSPEHIHIMLVREQHPEKDEMVWELRPANSDVLDAAYKHVCHLLPLRCVLMEKMQTEFIIGVDIYLKKVRDTIDSQAKMLQQKSHLLPHDFVDLPKVVQATFREQRRRQSQTPYKYVAGPREDPHGLQENCSGVSHPSVIASHDTIWHESGTKALPRPRTRTQTNVQKGSVGFDKDSNTSTAVQTTGGDRSVKQSSPGSTGSGNIPHKEANVKSDDFPHEGLGDEDDSRGVATRLTLDTPTSSPTCTTTSPSQVHIGDKDVDSFRVKLKESLVERPGGGGGDAAVHVGNHQYPGTSVRPLPDSTSPGCSDTERCGRDILREFMQSQMNSDKEDSLTSRFVLRPAGSFATNEKKKKKSVVCLGQTSTVPATSDLADDAKLDPTFREELAGSVSENSFDLIPSKSCTTYSHRPSLLGSSMLHPTHEDSGFKLSSFSEVQRPPVQTPTPGGDASPRKVVNAALADILPSVPSDSNISGGTRLLSRNRKCNVSVQQTSTGQCASQVTSPQCSQSQQESDLQPLVSLASVADSPGPAATGPSFQTSGSSGRVQPSAGGAKSPTSLLAAKQGQPQSLLQMLGVAKSPQERLLKTLCNVSSS